MNDNVYKDRRILAKALEMAACAIMRDIRWREQPEGRVENPGADGDISYWNSQYRHLLRLAAALRARP